MQTKLLIYIASAFIGYFLGSISPGIILSRNFANIDIRNFGSKNSGATNVLRVLGPHLGLLVFFFDILKAVVACFISQLIANEYTPYAAIVASIFIVLGHNWPIYYGFKGGKGVASSIACAIYLFPLEGLIAGCICLLIIYALKYVSVGSMSMLISFFIIILITQHDIVYYIWAFLLMILCLYRHKSNIQRLIKGKENKLGQKKQINKGE